MAIFDAYIDLLYSYRKTVNLTGVTAREDLEKIVADSACDLPEHARVLDLGSGGGIPGIPLKLLHPNIEISFCDKARKKMNIVSSLCFQLHITSKYVLIGDAREICKDHPGEFTHVVSRGMGEMAFVAECAFPFLTAGGMLLLWKPSGYDIHLSEVPNGYAFIQKVNKEYCSIVTLQKQ